MVGNIGCTTGNGEGGAGADKIGVYVSEVGQAG